MGHPVIPVSSKLIAVWARQTFVIDSPCPVVDTAPTLANYNNRILPIIVTVSTKKILRLHDIYF